MEFSVYGYEGNPRTRLVRIIAEVEGIPLQCVEVLPRMNVGKDEYMAKFPLSLGKIPAIEGPHVKFTETVAIFVYLAKLSNKVKLLGDGSIEQESQVLSYLSWANQEFLGILATWYLPLIPGFKDPPSYDEAAIIKGKTKSLEVLTTVEGLLAGRDWLVGDHLTLADITLAVYLSRGFEWVLDAGWRKNHPSIMKHFHAVTEQAAVKKIAADFTLIEEETPMQDPYKGIR